MFDDFDIPIRSIRPLNLFHIVGPIKSRLVGRVAMFFSTIFTQLSPTPTAELGTF